MKSRSEKAALNIAVLMTYEVVAFVCGLILPRLILSHFGSTYNGLISSVSQFLSFISILRLGIAGSSRVALYSALAKDDKKKVSGLVNATEQYMRKVGIALLVFIGVLALVYPFAFTSDIDKITTALLVVAIGLGAFGQYFFGITYSILLTADQTQYIYNGIQIIQTILNTLVSAVLIYAGCNIVVVKLGSAVVFAIMPLALSIIVRRMYNIDKKVKPDKSALNGRWDVMGHSIANIVHNKTDIVVLTLFEDIKIVSVYTVYYLVINGLNSITKIFTTGLEAAFGNMFANGEIDTANRDLDIFEYLMYSFATVVFSCTLVLIVPFVILYTEGITDANYITPLFAVLAVLAQMYMCIRQPYLTIVQAAGHYKQTRNGAFAEAIINIVISVALTFRFGLVGVTIGTLVANLFRTFQYIFYLRNNILNRSVWKAISMMIWQLATTVAIVGVCEYILSFINIGGWVQWIFSGVICFTVAFALTIIASVVFYRKRLNMALKVLKNMLRRRKK